MVAEEETIPEDIEAILERILASPKFASSENLRRFLCYVVEQKLQGKEREVKAYSIAVDALGQPESFDPQVDPKVRILAGRLRMALNQYHHTEGKTDKFKIEMPKGAYRIVFQQNPLSDEAGIEDQRPNLQTKRTDIWRPIALSALVIGVLAFIWIGYHTWSLSSETSRQLAEKTADPGPPVLEISPFGIVPDSSLLHVQQGIRQQLVVDLAHFKLIRVRSLSPESTSPTSSNQSLTPATYRLDGAFLKADRELRLNLTATGVADGTILWSKSVGMPHSDAEFHKFVFETIREIVAELASNSGLILTDAIQRLKSRAERLGNVSTSEYQCLLFYYAFDLEKRTRDEESARSCLRRLTQANTPNGSIWASWAFMQFLDWTKAKSESKQQLLDQSIIAIHTAIRLDSSDATAHEYLGSILMAVGKRADALQSYERAIELNPSKPDLYVLFGWHKVLDGVWDEGISEIRNGVQMSPSPPGWMRIPLSISAFRNENYEEALSEAKLIIESGDNRGVVLALAASIRLQQLDSVKKYSVQFSALKSTNNDNPMAEIRSVFNSPEILQKYVNVLKEAPAI